MPVMLSALYVYPIKSCRGIELKEASVTESGIEHDRSWLLVDEAGKALTQRDYPCLSLVQPEIVDRETLRIECKDKSPLMIRRVSRGAEIEVTVWNDKCRAVVQSQEASQWFSTILGRECRLVTMADDFVRPVDPKYAGAGKQVGFADGFPFLAISESSLEDLNSKLEVAVPMNRFRPNLVFSGTEPFAEDLWKEIRIGGLSFYVVKPCARCVMTTIDQEFAVLSKEPLRTLSNYRKNGNKILFGQNLTHAGTGIIRVGDRVEIIRRKEKLLN